MGELSFRPSAAHRFGVSRAIESHSGGARSLPTRDKRGHGGSHTPPCIFRVAFRTLHSLSFIAGLRWTISINISLVVPYSCHARLRASDWRGRASDLCGDGRVLEKMEPVGLGRRRPPPCWLGSMGIITRVTSRRAPRTSPHARARCTCTGRRPYYVISRDTFRKTVLIIYLLLLRSSSRDNSLVFCILELSTCFLEI